ncbi:hypothetical protein ACFVR0_18165 [Bacillus altitudinis]|uniref:hypothetical protein n=1 Tax=Bacillus altitudinis TaxID=293387 RepID=UPI0020BEA401|nr:hypothetical protein [Bacillus altitudinis]
MNAQVAVKPKSFDDESPLKGIFSDFVYLKDHHLVNIIQVEGVNIDLLSDDESNQLFNGFGEFLARTVHYKPQTVSMSVPIKMVSFLETWKKRYIWAANNRNLITEALFQSIASYVVHYQKYEVDADINVKAHFIVIREKLKQPSHEEFNNAQKRLIEKREEVISGVNVFLAEYDCTPRVLNGKECSFILHQFLDYKNSIYNN